MWLEKGKNWRGRKKVRKKGKGEEVCRKKYVKGQYLPGNVSRRGRCAGGEGNKREKKRKKEENKKERNRENIKKWMIKRN